MKKRIGIIGAAGYTGEELLKTLARHDGVEVVFATSERECGVPISRVFPHLPSYNDLLFSSAEEAAMVNVDLVFTCLHAGESVKWAALFLDKGARVIDLGSDFRFTAAQDYETWYQMVHPRPDLLTDAVYGLVEWHREKIRSAAVVGNPGCYPTSVLLALLPFVRAELLTDAPIIIDAKSGVSGAGKKPSDATHFVAVNENLSPYKVGRVHRHVGEMEKELGAFGFSSGVIFTPHLTPVTRGMLSTIYVQLKKETPRNELLEVLNNAYAGEPFVRVLTDQLPSMKMAQNSNFCFLGVEAVPEMQHAILFSAIDNLGKGASTQAVQNMNVILGFEETKGLM
jgi:N-acetyl-gamma-glutamyl-phosphate reductase